MIDLRQMAFETKLRVAGGAPYAAFLRASREADGSDVQSLLGRQALAAGEMARYAAERTDWYGKAYAPYRADLERRPADPSVFHTLPMLTKEDVRAHFDEFIARDSGVRKISESTTGGSTGVPLRVLRDVTVGPAALSWRMLGWWGVHPSDDSAELVRGPRHGLRLVAHNALWWPTRRIHMDAGAVNLVEMRQFVEHCRRVRPRLLVGYAGFLHEVARIVIEQGWEFPPPVAVSSTAGPLTPIQRMDITAAFGAPVYNTYRTGEVSYLGGQCELMLGLHVMADQRLVEVVDDEGRPVPPGEQGQVVVTDLLNHAFPLVRYQLNDVASFSQEPCPCGRPFPVLTGVLGRSNDLIRTPSGTVSAYSFASVLAEHPGVRQYQLHQLADYSLLIKIVPASHDVRSEDFEAASASVRRQLGGELTVSVELVAHIDHERGKQKTIISHLPV